MRQKYKTKLNEQGFASIVIALVLIIVLALLTIGFAQLARREQRSALDRQLADQAYYAAETGVNDVVKALPAIQSAGSTVNKNKCLDTSAFSLNPTVNQTNGVYYTCVLVDLKPPDIQYSGVQPESERYIITSTSPAARSLTVNWGSADAQTTFPRNKNGKFMSSAAWTNLHYPGVLQFSVTPVGGGALNSDTLVKDTFTAYLYPTSGASNILTYNTIASQNGPIAAAHCDLTKSAQYPCSVTINGLNGTGPYLLRVVDHYDSSNVSISGKDNLGQPVGFDGQIQVDVTGKAQEVLKRIRVRKAVHPSYSLPKDALESQDICKRFTTDPSGAQPSPPAGYTGTACNLN